MHALVLFCSCVICVLSTKYNVSHRKCPKCTDPWGAPHVNRVCVFCARQTREWDFVLGIATIIRHHHFISTIETSRPFRRELTSSLNIHVCSHVKRTCLHSNIYMYVYVYTYIQAHMWCGALRTQPLTYKYINTNTDTDTDRQIVEVCDVHGVVAQISSKTRDDDADDSHLAASSTKQTRRHRCRRRRHRRRTYPGCAPMLNKHTHKTVTILYTYICSGTITENTVEIHDSTQSTTTTQDTAHPPSTTHRRRRRRSSQHIINRGGYMITMLGIARQPALLCGHGIRCSKDQQIAAWTRRPNTPGTRTRWTTNGSRQPSRTGHTPGTWRTRPTKTDNDDKPLSIEWGATNETVTMAKGTDKLDSQIARESTAETDLRLAHWCCICVMEILLYIVLIYHHTYIPSLFRL